MTRKLLGLSLLAILLLTGFAFGQVYNVWYGGSFDGATWTDTTYVTIPSPWNQATNVNIPVFIKGDPGMLPIADLHLPLGVLDANIDDIPAALCSFNFWPFNGPAAPPDTGAGWDEISFLTTFETAPPNVAGYHSRSFFGISTTGGGPNRMIYPTALPQQYINFVVHFPVVDTLVTYNPLRDGMSSTAAGPAAGDEFGSPAGLPLSTHYSFIKFVAQHNLAPVISPIADITNHLAVPTFTVIDADGPTPLTVTADHGTINNLGGGNYSITLAAGYCGPVIITATDGAAASSTEEFVVLNSAPVITYLGADPVTTTSVQSFDIVDANNDMITPVLSGTCVVTITTNVPGHLAGTIAVTSVCNTAHPTTITINATDPCGANATQVSFVNDVTSAPPVFGGGDGTVGPNPHGAPSLPVDGGVLCLFADQCINFSVIDENNPHVNPADFDVTINNAAYGEIIKDSVKVVGNKVTWFGRACLKALTDDVVVCGDPAIPVTDDPNEVIITATGISVQTLTFTREGMGTITVSMPDSLNTGGVGDWGFWPGFEDSIPVVMTAPASCFCLGGFELTVTYDNSIFQLYNVTKDPSIEAAEYFYVNYFNTPGVPQPPICEENQGRNGVFKVIMLWNLNNQLDPQPICYTPGEGDTLFWIHGVVVPGNYQTNFCVPICFYACDRWFPGSNYNWNAVTDNTGLAVWKTEGCGDTLSSTWYLNFDCGNIKVWGPDQIIPGDVNHNGQRYEIGDVVALANYLGDPTSSPLFGDRYAWYSSDINGDGIPATIADLVMLIRIVTNQMPIPGGKVAPIDVEAIANMNGNNVTITSEANLGGAVVTIDHTGEIGVPTANGMDIKYSDKNGVMTVVAYSLTGNALGNKISINVPVLNGTATLSTVSTADINGAMLNAKLGVQLPTEFSVAQNYPNPFNVKTAIKVALPTTATVNVTIYNVAGQLVQTINAGELAAGVHSIIWDASNVGSGVYFYKVAAGDQTKTLKMTLLK